MRGLERVRREWISGKRGREAIKLTETLATPAGWVPSARPKPFLAPSLTATPLLIFFHTPNCLLCTSSSLVVSRYAAVKQFYRRAIDAVKGYSTEQIKTEYPVVCMLVAPRRRRVRKKIFTRVYRQSLIKFSSPFLPIKIGEEREREIDKIKRED